MEELRDKIDRRFISEKHSKGAREIIAEELYDIFRKEGRFAKVTPELSKRLITFAIETRNNQQDSPTPLKDEVLLVWIPFDEFGNVQFDEPGNARFAFTWRVKRPLRDPMQIIDKTVKHAIDWTMELYPDELRSP